LRSRLLPLIATLIAPLLAHGDDVGHDEARRLRQAGTILPVETILERLLLEQPGRLLDLELERDDGRYVYELEMLDSSGTVWELLFDARTGALIKRERED
jgi:uncharacterized membrane protein YkoI